MGVGKERRGEERVKGDGYFGDGDEDVRCAADCGRRRLLCRNEGGVESEGRRGEEGSYAKYLQCFIVPPAHPTFRCAGMAPHGTQGGKEEKKRNDEFVSLSSFIIKPKNDKEEGGTSRGR